MSDQHPSIHQSSELASSAANVVEGLIRSLQIGVVIQLPSTEIVLCNPKALELLGLTESQLLGKTSLDPDWNVIHEDGSPFLGPVHPVPQAIETRRLVRDVVMGVYRPVLRDRVWILVTADPQLDAHGNVVHVVCTFTDISANKQAEKEKLRVAERLRVAIRASNIGLWDWDLQTNKVRYSSELKLLLGYDDAELTDDYSEWETRLHPDDAPFVLKRLNDYLAGTENDYEVEFRMRHRDGSWRWVYSRGEAIRDRHGAPESMIGCHLDVTERKQMLTDIQFSKLRLESLSRDLISSREAELHHLARELHDEFGQTLTAVKMHLQSLKLHTDQNAHSHLDTSIAMLDDAVSQIRALTLDLRPPHLDELGLVATLHWYLKRQAQIAGFEEQLTVTPAGLSVDPRLAIVCFRIVQEAVTNAIKHAFPSRIEIELRQDETFLSLTIRDDGRGFEVDNLTGRSIEGEHMGLVSMSERAGLAHGSFAIESRVGRGTTVRVAFPLDQRTGESTYELN